MSKKWFIFFFVLFALVFLGPVPYTKTLSNYIVEVSLNLSMLPFMFLFVVLANRIRRRLGTNTKATIEELHREDDVLLQGTAFSQSVFFIYLNQIQSSFVVEILRWTVPIVAVAFYAMRAYAKIKDSPKHRYYSILVLMMIMAEVGLFVLQQITPRFYVEESDIVGFYLPLVAGGLFILFMFGFSNALRRRYGYI